MIEKLIQDIFVQEKELTLHKQEFGRVTTISATMMENMKVDAINDYLSRSIQLVFRTFAPKEVTGKKTVTFSVKVPATWQDMKKLEETPFEERTEDFIQWKELRETYEFEESVFYPRAPKEIFGAFVKSNSVSITVPAPSHYPTVIEGDEE